MRKKVQTTIYLEDDQHEDLKRLSREMTIPYSVLVREGVERVLKAIRDGNLTWSR